MFYVASMADAQSSIRRRRRSKRSLRAYAASVGLRTVWASAASTTSRGVLVRSAAQSRKVSKL